MPARGLKQVVGSTLTHALDMLAEQLPKSKGERNQTIFVSFPLVDTDLAAVQVHIDETDHHELAHANACVEECFDKYHIRELACLPHGFVEASDLFFRGNLWQAFRATRHLNF